MKRFATIVAGLPLALSLSLGMVACDKQTETVDPEPKPEAAEPEAAEPVWPDEEFRATRPTPKPIKDTPIPEIETFELSNGMKVYLVQQKTLPTVYMLFDWEIGEVNDPKGKTGLGSLCADLLDEGTKSKDKAAFSAAQADHAVTVSSSGGGESSFMTVRTLERELPAALDLAAEMLLEPGLREDDFERLRKQKKARLEQSKGSASSIAYRLFPSLIWGSKHAYGKLETAESLDKVTLADCGKWAKKLKPDGAELWVVGKITKEKLIAEFDSRFAKWKGKAPKPVKLKDAKPAKGTVFFVDVPGSAQSQILIGHPGPQRDVPDYEATQLMAAILGGSFSSRINMNLREDKGWAYGARGSFRYSRAGSYFTAGSSVRTDTTGGAVREIFKEIEIMRSTDPTQVEVTREQQGALLSLPAEFATATRTLFEFRGLTYYGLPLDWHAGHQERMRAVDIQAIRTAAETHLQATDHVVLVVGDGSVVLEELEAIAAEGMFGKGGIQYLDPDGNPISKPEKADKPEKSAKPQK